MKQFSIGNRQSSWKKNKTVERLDRLVVYTVQTVDITESGPNELSVQRERKRERDR